MHLDKVARTDAGIGALQAIQPDDVEPGIFAIGPDRARRSRALADDFDHVAFGNAQLLHQLEGQARDAASAVRGRQVRHLHPPSHGVDIRHPLKLSLCWNKPHAPPYAAIGTAAGR